MIYRILRSSHPTDIPQVKKTGAAMIEKRVTQKGKISYRVKIYHKGIYLTTASFETRASAQRWEREKKRDLEHGRSVSCEAEVTTLGQAFERYLKEITPHKKGHKEEARKIKGIQKDKIARLPLNMIRGSTIAKIRDEMLERGLSPSTIQKHLAVISHLYTICRKEWGMEDLSNPVQAIRLPRINNERDRRLEEGEEERVLEACGKHQNTWLKPMVIVAIESAMRKGELISLRWENVDLVKQTAFLPDTKNGSSRTVPLSKRAVAMLKTLPRSINGEVFQTSEYATRKAWIRQMKLAGIENLRFHDLRHEATSRLAEIFQAHELCKITGHKDTKMVLRYYHPRAEDLAKRMG